MEEGGGDGGLCAEQVTVQCVVRVANTGPLDCMGGEEDERKQEGWHRLRGSFQTGPSHPAMACGCRETLTLLHYRQSVKYKSANVELKKRLQTPLGSVLP